MKMDINEKTTARQIDECVKLGVIFKRLTGAKKELKKFLVLQNSLYSFSVQRFAVNGS